MVCAENVHQTDQICIFVEPFLSRVSMRWHAVARYRYGIVIQCRYTVQTTSFFHLMTGPPITRPRRRYKIIIEPPPISSLVRLLITKLFWASDERFKTVSCVVPQIGCIHGVQIWRIIRLPLFLFNHLQAVLIEALMRDICNARRAGHMHVAESAASSGSSRLHSSMNVGSRN